MTRPDHLGESPPADRPQPETRSQLLCSVLASMSFVPVAEDSDFPIHNLPYGVFSTTGNVSCHARLPGAGREGVPFAQNPHSSLWLRPGQIKQDVELVISMLETSCEDPQCYLGP